VRKDPHHLGKTMWLTTSGPKKIWTNMNMKREGRFPFALGGGRTGGGTKSDWCFVAPFKEKGARKRGGGDS